MDSDFVAYTVTESRLFLIAQAPMLPFNHSSLPWCFVNTDKANSEKVVVVNMTLGGYELHHEANILKLNNIMFSSMLEIQLTSNQQVGGSSPPGIAMLSCALSWSVTPAFPEKPPVSCFVDNICLSSHCDHARQFAQLRETLTS